MEDLKFRGKRIDTGNWVYGYYLKYPCEFDNYDGYALAVNFEPVIADINCCNKDLRKIDIETLGYSTGVPDIHKKEAYLGDILKKEISMWLSDAKKEDAKNKKAFYVVKKESKSNNLYLEYNFNIRGYWERTILSISNISDLEIVGNIYDNHELLNI